MESEQTAERHAAIETAVLDVLRDFGPLTLSGVVWSVWAEHQLDISSRSAEEALHRVGAAPRADGRYGMPTAQPEPSLFERLHDVFTAKTTFTRVGGEG